MAKLELQHLSGDVETHELSKREPLSIGNHVSNDICIRGDDVAVMHCRISWAKKAYEVTAANLDGVELNGTLVRQALLRPGDVLRIGSVDIAVRYDEGEVDPDSIQAKAGESGKGDKGGGQPTSEVDLKPITEGEIFTEPQSGRPADAAAGEKGSRKRGKSKKKKPDAEQSILENLDADLGKDIDSEDDAVRLPDDIFEEDEDEAEAPDEVAAQPMIGRSTTFAKKEAGKDAPQEKAGQEGEQPKEKGESLISTLRARLTPKAVRPGEQDILQSPFVLMLGGGTAVLVLVSLTFWFMIGRETASRLYDAAVQELNEGKYTHAEKRFDEFLSKYPQHKLTELALIGRGKARIEKEIAGATPNWPRGLETMQEFIRRCRDLPSFPEHHDKLREYAEKTAKGAAESAEQGALRAGKLEDVTAQERLLQVSRDAETIVDRYSPPDAPPDQLQKQIEAARAKAEAAIRKQTRFYTEVLEIEKAIKAKTPMLALAARQRLLDNYPGFREHKKVRALLEETLDAEKSLVTPEELDRAALTEKRQPPVPGPLSLTLHTRSRTDEVSAGRAVFAVGKDCCFGIDTVTGDPKWRRVIGLDTPFFPIRVETSVPAVLVFDTNHKELVLLNRVNGELIWRQTIGEDLGGPPLIHEGQIYLPTLANHLYRIDVDTGRIRTRLTFSQKVLAPPVLISYSKRNGLVLAGDVALLYTLSIRPLLACEAVSDLGHKAGSIQSPLVKMGRLVLMAENSHLEKCRLRALEVNEQTKRISQAAEKEINGQVRDTPVLRGKTLLVPHGQERIAAFTASDDGDQRPLTPIATHPLQNPVPGPMFLFAGPDDQVWMASSALRKLYLKTESIKLDPTEAAVGLSSQPLQSIGRWLYVGRQMPYSRAVFFTQTDRDEMTSYWRTVVGSRVLAMTVSQQGAAVCVTEEGSVFRISAEQIEQGGFLHEAAASLKLHENLRDPLRAVLLSDGRIAVHCGAPEPRLWIVNQAGQIEQQTKLDEPLEADPVVMGTGIVLPLPGKLRYVGRQSSTARVEDFVAPVAKERKTTWVQLAALDENQLIAVDSQGKLARIQNRQQHLAEASKLQLDDSLDVNFCVHDGKIMLADAKARLRVLDASSMDTLSETKLDAPASNSLWLAGDRLFVETGREHLQCFAVKPELKRLWSVPLEGNPLAGEPLVSGKLLILARKNGDVWTLDPAAGSVGRRVNVGQPLSLGPMKTGNFLVVSSIGGSLYRVESALQAKTQAAEKAGEKR